ncbi:hypothetical protein DIS24_g6059 [Lasiodiplodia hormozganensis]|uniref:DNA/RNA-binding protein Alba-like domain-containing protein n=1 Tax=Lasiodiplodia hormozganensis TaxID=869390 RepID=A0AA39YLV7_9PEZI|nr:hypothetical protein DIS24_g6059 [Lasiodiplodia hormozganensis]
MARKNKQHPPSSPAALVSNKRRRLASLDNASPAAPAVSTASPSSTFACATALAAPAVHIVAGSKIQAKVRAVLSALNATAMTESKPPSAADADTAQDDVPPAEANKNFSGIVRVEAHAAGASKLITIIEIVKRTLESTGRPWWTYTGVKGTLEEFKSRENTRSNQQQRVLDHDAHEDALLDGSPGEGDEEEAFEPTAHGQIRSGKIRSVPHLFVYLAIKPLPPLKALYGEQCSEA